MTPPAPDLEELKAQLEQAKKDLEMMERAKSLGLVTSSVVHDIRNSLGVISSTSQFVLNKLEPSEKEREAWMLVERNVDNIKKILKGFLGLARQAESVKQAASLNDLAARVSHFIDTQARRQNTKIETALAPGLPDIVIDAFSLESCILNLSINSLEALGQAGKLVLKTRHDRDQKMIFLEIEDDGPGMTPEAFAKKFTPFFTTKKTGTGMGLYSAKLAVEQNGGTLTCESRAGQGTRMILAFSLNNV